MEVERKLIFDVFEKMTKMKIDSTDFTVLAMEIPRVPEIYEKDVVKSVASRKLGNDLYFSKDHSQKTHEEAWKHYCESIAFAPNDSEELAIGYADRSVLLFHLRKYEESLEDIKRALGITKLCALKVKLFCREAECFVALQEGKQNSSLEKARYWLNKVEDDCESLKLKELIEKAQQVIEDNIPDCQEKEEKNELKCHNNAVGISYDKQYGRCLIANRDIQTGEFVYIEKFYVNSVNISKLYAYCSHCLAISYALIPCDHCAYYMFCGKKCKDEAWEKYHDIECQMQLGNHQSFGNHCIRLSIRAVIMGIKEAGSIKNFKALVDKMEKHKDVKSRRFLSLDKFSGNSFEGLFSLCSSCDFIRMYGQEDNLVRGAISAASVLTTLFRNSVEEAVIFLGSVIVRLYSTAFVNAFHVLQFGVGCSDPDVLFPRCLIRACCSRGMNISLFTSLINHSCDSNVCKLYTNDGRVVYYAVKPIKKNSQIFESYYCDYTLAKKERRERVLYTLFSMDYCGCLACVENWPDITTLRIQQKTQYNDSIKKVLKKYKKLEKQRLFSKKAIDEIVKDIDKSLQNSTGSMVMHTELRCIFISIMQNHYFDILKVPEKCRDREQITA